MRGLVELDTIAAQYNANIMATIPPILNPIVQNTTVPLATSLTNTPYEMPRPRALFSTSTAVANPTTPYVARCPTESDFTWLSKWTLVHVCPIKFTHLNYVSVSD